MGGFSDNYECGYWGEDTPPMQMNKKFKNSSNNIHKKELYIKTSDEKHHYLQVLLSPIELLTDEEQEERTNLMQLCNTETALEFSIENRELKIYYDDFFIGSVQKIFENEGLNHTNIVDAFCFEGNEPKEIEAFWSGDVFFLREKPS